MNADIITSTSFPHGTPDGYLQGCHGAHCPAPMACRDVHRRHSGDFVFRRAFDAGTPIAEIVAAEHKAAQEALQAAKDARRKRPGPRAKAKPLDGRATANRARAHRYQIIPREQLRELLDQGLTDRQIADKVGLERRQVTGARVNAGWERNPDITGRQSIDRLIPTVAHLTLEDAAKQLGRTVSYVRRRRQIVARNHSQAPAQSGLSS